MPILGDVINDHNGMIEVVSDLEYNIALQIIDAKRIINIDSQYEIEYIKELLNEDKIKEACIGIRINFKVLHYISQFGFNIENEELDRALNSLNQDKRIKIVSIH